MKLLRNRALALLLAAMLPLSLTACASGSPAATAASTQAPQSAAPTATDAPAETPETGEPETDQPEAADAGGILIAYFTAAENSGVDAVASASYTTLAERIQQNVGGDLFSIRTSVVYPADGGELIDYAAQEQEENARPELTTHIENLDGYDTIFIGYPNWWADLPMAVYSFFDEYDFSGKTIIPFNVHNGSRFSRTIQTIQELEPDATVLEDGFTVSEQTVAEAAEDVAAWLEGLGY